MELRAAGHTDTGLTRAGNEDAYFCGETVFAVADGLGGHQAGEVASAIAIEPVAALDGRRFEETADAREAVAAAVADANRAVWRSAEADPAHAGMGTTLTAALVHGDAVLLAHVGDSRAYLRRGAEGLARLTSDHTPVEEMVRAGQLSAAEAARHPERSVLSRALGLEPEVEVDTPDPLGLRPGDRVLLCSDGLTEPLSDDEIAGILDRNPDTGAACRALVDAANERGGPDNITVVLLDAAPVEG